MTARNILAKGKTVEPIDRSRAHAKRSPVPHFFLNYIRVYSRRDFGCSTKLYDVGTNGPLRQLISRSYFRLALFSSKMD
jgi:hypothetical protein